VGPSYGGTCARGEDDAGGRGAGRAEQNTGGKSSIKECMNICMYECMFIYMYVCM
jgi:hypothetical protein